MAPPGSLCGLLALGRIGFATAFAFAGIFTGASVGLGLAVAFAFAGVFALAAVDSDFFSFGHGIAGGIAGIFGHLGFATAGGEAGQQSRGGR